MTTLHTDENYDEEIGDPSERLKICGQCEKGFHQECSTTSCGCPDSSHKIKAVEDVALD